ALITSAETKKLSEISIITEREKTWLLTEFNQTETCFPKDKTIIQLFEEQVARFGRNNALVWGDETLTYLELNQKANQLAQRLAKNHAKSGDRVAILLNRGPLQIISILAILKLGCVYVPIDPAYPNKRINFMLENSESTLILTHAKFKSRLGVPVRPILLDSLPVAPQSDQATPIASAYAPAKRSSDGLAYIMYTSGSTGTPKGTLITHRNVIRVVKETNYITVLPTDRFLQLSNYAFDGSVFDIFGALLNGACLYIVPKELAIEIPQLAQFIQTQKITVFFITSSLFNALVDWDVNALENTRKVLVGGEAISVAHARKALETLGVGRIINGYGPTETTVFASYYPIDHIEQAAQSVPIGYPLANTKLYVLDKQGQLAPPNTPGELYIGGDGVGKGYLNRDELTQQKFLDNPFEEGGKLYRTGDLVQMLPDGAIDYIGRIDFQIKIRGFRVELGEIENYIKSVAGINEVVVVAPKDQTGSMYIAAYYTVDPHIHTIDSAQISEFLSDKLPDYMIPTRMKQLDALPLNMNGKVDRNSLPVIEDKQDQLSNYLAPRNDLERRILENMQAVLDNRRIGIQDNFFKFGGQSIKAIALIQALRKQGIELNVSDVFHYPTVESLATLPKVQNLHTHKIMSPAVARQSAEPVPLITLNEQQLDSVVGHVQNTCSLISQMIVAAGKVTQFPLSPVQKAHNEAGSNLSGLTTQINGDLDSTAIRHLLLTIIQNNQLLHAVVEEDGGSLVWKECDITAISALLATQIPYLDLCEYTESTKEAVLKQLYGRILLSPYQQGQLPWRMCCLRTSQDAHTVIWGFDHTAFDGMSAEVIRRQIAKATAQTLGETGQAGDTPQKYQEYVSWLARGPQAISEQALVERFALAKWSKANQTLMTTLAQIPDRNQQRVTVSIPLAEIGSADIWQFAFDWTVDALRNYAGMSEIPLALVQYGRSYQEKDYYNCVGEFLDIIPLLIGEGEATTAVLERLKLCRTHAINFFALLFDEKLAAKFSTVAGLLSASYTAAGQSKPFVL
ncbi:MAG TPA: amino acid adenylation domain-containing protein, partial [Anaerolineae bacterium]|nr:amino acid adenylation domain-containing protein [Anaerolineae bacterium]